MSLRSLPLPSRTVFSIQVQMIQPDRGRIRVVVQFAIELSNPGFLIRLPALGCWHRQVWLDVQMAPSTRRHAEARGGTRACDVTPRASRTTRDGISPPNS